MVLRPWLGSLFLTSNPMLDQLTQMMRGYAPYKQTLEDLRDQLESFLLTSISRYTHGSMMVLNDQYKTVLTGTLKGQIDLPGADTHTTLHQ